jgi:hypothetical protein
MPSMDWEDFQHDHHRPHVLIVSMEARKPRHALEKADVDRLVSRLGAIGNYAIKKEGTAIHIAFEGDADADRLAAVLRPKQTTRESEWASKSLASIDDAAHRRISAFLERRCGISAPKRIKPRLTRLNRRGDNGHGLAARG